MTLLRFAARTMLASYFVASGVKALRDPDALVPAAEPLVDRVVPTVQAVRPGAGQQLHSRRSGHADPHQRRRSSSSAGSPWPPARAAASAPSCSP